MKAKGMLVCEEDGHNPFLLQDAADEESGGEGKDMEPVDAIGAGYSIW